MSCGVLRIFYKYNPQIGIKATRFNFWRGFNIIHRILWSPFFFISVFLASNVMWVIQPLLHFINSQLISMSHPENLKSPTFCLAHRVTPSIVILKNFGERESRTPREQNEEGDRQSIVKNGNLPSQVDKFMYLWVLTEFCYIWRSTSWAQYTFCSLLVLGNALQLLKFNYSTVRWSRLRVKLYSVVEQPN